MIRNWGIIYLYPLKGIVQPNIQIQWHYKDIQRNDKESPGNFRITKNSYNLINQWCVSQKHNLPNIFTSSIVSNLVQCFSISKKHCSNEHSQTFYCGSIVSTYLKQYLPDVCMFPCFALVWAFPCQLLHGFWFSLMCLVWFAHMRP